jgi:hypothetical protein
MGTQAIESVLHLQLSASEKAVLLILAHRVNDRRGDWSCSPSVAGLASDTGLSTRSVIRAIASLEQGGIIVANHRQGMRTGYVIRCQPVTSANPSLVTNQPVTSDTVSGTSDTLSKTSDTVAPEQEEHQEQEEKHLAEQAPPSADEPAGDEADRTGPDLITREGVGWRITTGMLRNLQDAHPGIDILIELRKAALWIAGNPRRRKTARGMLRFVTTWVSRAKPVQQNLLQMPPQEPLPTAEQEAEWLRIARGEA